LDPDSATSASKTEQESDAEEVNAFAALVWAYVSASGALVQELDTDVGPLRPLPSPLPPPVLPGN